MANECYNYFEIIAPTEGLTSLYALLNSTPDDEHSNGWLDVLNVLLATDATTGTRDDSLYELLEDEEKRDPAETMWTLTENEDGSSTLGWTCFTKWFGYADIVDLLVDFLETNYSLIRFEFLESEPATHHGHWIAMSRNRNGRMKEEFSRAAVDVIWDEDESDDDEVKFLNPTGLDLDSSYPITVWDDGTFTDMSNVLPLTAVTE